MFRATWGYYIKSRYAVGGHWGARAPSAGPKRDPALSSEEMRAQSTHPGAAQAPTQGKNTDPAQPSRQLQCFPF